MKYKSLNSEPKLLYLAAFRLILELPYLDAFRIILGKKSIAPFEATSNF